MEIIHPTLGRIKCVANPRTRRVVARMKDTYMQLTYHPSLRLTDIEAVVDAMFPQLLELKEKYSQSVFQFTPQTQFETFAFRLNLKESDYTNYYASLKDSVLNIVCPFSTDFKDDKDQTIIRQIVERSMRSEAKRLLPAKVAYWADVHQFDFSSVKINKSRTRWGSCSSKQSINLSYFCLLLPEYLIDLIILHELCHTIEMNHSERFWTLLDKVTNGKAKELTSELKSVKMTW